MGVIQAIPFGEAMAASRESSVLASRGIRVLVDQPALPLYRLPVFKALAERQNIRLTVHYNVGRTILNARPNGFDAQLVQRNILNIGGAQLLWSNSQWQSAGAPDFDVLMLNWNMHYASLIPALLRARYHGKATILWGHGYSKHENLFRRWPREQAAKLATALLFYNHATARHFTEMGFDPRRIFVALNALDQNPIQSARGTWLERPQALQTFREQHDLIDRPIVLFVSRLDPANRADLLIRATARLSRMHPRLHTVIIGQGPDESRLRALARQLNIASRIRFLGAVYDEHDLAPWFLSASAFCYPANIGLSVLHAMGYGLPVVTGDELATHNPEIEALQHGVNGLLFQHDRACSLTDALHHLIVDPTFRGKLASAARETAIERFTLGGMVDGMMSAITYAAQFSRA